jgi:hypothetical protein
MDVDVSWCWRKSGRPDITATSRRRGECRTTSSFEKFTPPQETHQNFALYILKADERGELAQQHIERERRYRVSQT